MALSKIQAESMNLADTYTFTGTISGTPQGLTLINQTSSSTTVSSFSIDNVFSSTYQHYRVYMRVEYSSVGDGYYMRLLQSDGSERGSNYYFSMAGHGTDDTTFTGGSTNVSTFYIGRHSGGDVAGGGNRGGHYIFDLYRPYVGTATNLFGEWIGYHDSNDKYTAGYFRGFNSNQETHRGFKVVGNTGSSIIQHDVWVYGVTNA